MKKSTKKIMILYSLILVATLLSETILANAIAATFTISPGVYPAAPAFSLWKEGSIYYAKDRYGSISYSGAVAETVINNALTSMGTLDEIHFEPGQYTITDSILIANQQIVFSGSGSRNTALIAGANDFNMCEISVPYVLIKDIGFSGNNSSNTGVNGITTIGTTNCIDLHHVYIHQCDGWGFYGGWLVDSCWTDVLIEGCGSSGDSEPAVSIKSSDLKAFDLRIHNAKFLGLELRDAGSNNYFSGFKFEGYNTADGVLFKNTTNENQFVGATITSANTFYLSIEGACQGEIFMGSTFNYLTAASPNGWLIDGDYNRFIGNQVIDGNVTDTGVDNLFLGNRGIPDS